MPEILGTSKNISGFDPRSIGGCQVWLDGSDPAGTNIPPANGASVSTWADKSGSGYNFTASSAATYNSTFKAVLFNSNLYSSSYPANPTTETIFIVARPTSISPGQALISGYSGSRGVWVGNSGGGNGSAGVVNSVIAWLAVTAAGTVPANVTVLVTEQINAGTSYIALNGSSTFNTGGVGFTSGTVTYLGAESGSGGPYLGYAMEIIIYNVYLTTSQRQQVEGYLAWKWGLEVIPQAPSVPGVVPSSISGLSLWLDGADQTSAGMTLSGTSVTSWKDKSGNGRHLTASSAYPTITSGGLLFNGATPNVLSNAASFPMANGITSFVVFNSTVASTRQRVFVYVYTGQKIGVAPDTTFNSVFSSTIGGDGPVTYSANTTYIYGGNTYAVSPFVSHSENGVETQYPSTYSVNSSSQTQLLVGGVSGVYFTGTIKEVILYDAFLTVVQRQQVEAYLATKWGVQVTPFTPLLSRPANVPGCVLWLDGADASTLTLSGSNVTQWKDKSGNGYNGTATNASVGSPVAPTYVTNSINGLPAVTMSGTSYFTGSTDVNSTTLTAFFIGNCVFGTGGSTQQRILGLGVTGLDDYSSTLRPIPLAVINSGTTLLAYRNANMATATVVSGTNFLGCCLFDGTSNYMYKDGSLGTQVASSGTFTTSIYGVGSDAGVQNSFGASSFGTNCLVGKIGEIIVFNTALNTTQRQAVERYLSLKWGVANLYNTVPGSIPGLSLWLDGTDPAGTGFQPAFGSAVSTWVDKSGLGNNGTATGGSPIFTAKAINGTPAIYMSNAPGFRGNISITGTTLTCFAVAVTPSIPNALGHDQRLVSLAVNTSGADYTSASTAIALMNWAAYDASSIVTYRNSGPIASNAISANVAFIAASEYDGTNGYLWKDGKPGSSPSAGSTGSFATGVYGVGEHAATIGGAECWNGYIGEVMIYSTALTTSQRQAVESYLSRKWGVLVPTEALPVNHPFETIQPSLRRFNPVDVGVDLALWLDAADASTIQLSGASNVVSWKDKSPNAYLLSNTTTASQPTYVTSGLNKSYPCVRVNGSTSGTQFLTTPLFTGLNGTTWDVYVVVRIAGGYSAFVWFDPSDRILILAGLTGIAGPAAYAIHWGSSGAGCWRPESVNRQYNLHVLLSSIQLDRSLDAD
jgi:hypothetical protein